MIDRYAPAELRAIWSDESRIKIWLQVELAVCRARAELGDIPPAEMGLIEKAHPPALARARELEEE